MRHATRRRSDRSRRSLARVAAAGAAAGAAAWVLVTGWAATPAAAQARPARVAPDPNAAARRERLAQFQAAERAARDLPRLPATRPDDVFRLGVRNRAIVVEVVPGSDGRRPTGDRPYRVDFPAVAAGPVTVEFSSLSTFQRLGIGGRGDESFTLNACEMASPDALTTVELQVSPNSFQVERTTQYDDGQWTVRLSGQRLGRDTSTAQLLVMRSGGGLSRPQTINAEAADLPSLLRENPREANTYLRPLLASLGQEHLFAPDVRVAWQVMAADHWPADPAVAAEVATLLPDLDAPDYHRRDAALARLVAMDRPGAAVLRQLERAGLSAEQDLTIDRALAPFAPLARGEATRLRTDRRFLIDCLCSDDEPTRAAAFRELLQLVGRVDLRYEPAAPTAARLTDVRKLRDELVPGPITRPR